MNLADCCPCYTIEPYVLRFCEEHHRYWFNDTERYSVSSVLTWALGDSRAAAEAGGYLDAFENANRRGVSIDRYFSEYLRAGALDIPDDESEDVKSRMDLLIPWWNDSGFEALETQKRVHDDTFAGTLDIYAKDPKGHHWILDLKCVSRIKPSYDVQLQAYWGLHEEGADRLGLIHVEKNNVRLLGRPLGDEWDALKKAYLVALKLGLQR